MSDSIVDKFRADIQISRARTGKPNPLLLTIRADDLEAVLDRAVAGEVLARFLKDEFEHAWYHGWCPLCEQSEHAESCGFRNPELVAAMATLEET